MNITAILCTYNRCHSLRKALTSLAASEVQPGVEWEVLVVDNNSFDDTRQVAEEFVRRYPGRFRYLFEAQPGKSHALNAGLGEAKGKILAFVDDDVMVDCQWLKNLCAPVLSGACSGAGGRVLPEQGVVFPAWISGDDRYVRGPLVMFDLGPSRLELEEAPFGTNMAFHRKMFTKHGGFRTDLGPPRGNEVRGEDSEFFYRLLAANERLCYEPAALVYHEVPAKRLCQEYFLNWWFDKGRSDVRTLSASPIQLCQVSGVPVIWLRRLAVWIVRWLITFDSSRRFAAKTRIWYVAGEVAEAYHQNRSKRHRAARAESVEKMPARIASTSGEV